MGEFYKVSAICNNSERFLLDAFGSYEECIDYIKKNLHYYRYMSISPNGGEFMDSEVLNKWYREHEYEFCYSQNQLKGVQKDFGFVWPLACKDSRGNYY